MRNYLLALIQVAIVQTALSSDSAAEPGPENGGLRLRLVVTSETAAAAQAHLVRLELLNVTDHELNLRANWDYDSNTGDFKDFAEAAASIEAYPALAPWVGQIQGPRRKTKQPEYVLKPGEVLSVSWQSSGKHLKNKVTNPLDVQNPEFPFPGLYSIHATISLPLGDRTVLLRSNEQLVSIGGSRELPKSTYGTLLNTDATNNTAVLDLGTPQKVAKGDEFAISPGIGQYWKLVITRAFLTYSVGRIEPLQSTPTTSGSYIPRFPERGASAVLITGR